MFMLQEMCLKGAALFVGYGLLISLRKKQLILSDLQLCTFLIFTCNSLNEGGFTLHDMFCRRNTKTLSG